MYLIFDPCVHRHPLSQYDEVEVFSWTQVVSDDLESPAKKMLIIIIINIYDEV